MIKTSFKEIALCSKCKGTGKIKVCNEREMHNHDIIECPQCDGDGSWVQITTIEYLKKTPELTAQLIR